MTISLIDYSNSLILTKSIIVKLFDLHLLLITVTALQAMLALVGLPLL